MQEQISSITNFLQQGDFHFRFFDLGRRVTRLSNQLFEKIENQQELYPYPFQQSAWLGLIFWDKQQKDEPVIWFLKFPIDELGYLQISSRDAFMQQLIDQLGMDIKAKQQGKQAVDSLKESPFAFKPKQDRLAIFHSKAAKILGLKPSNYYAHTREYLTGNIGYEQWKFLGLQGIADFITRIDEEDNEKLLIKAIPSIPDTPLEIICSMLEHAEPSRLLGEAIVTKLDSILASNNKPIVLLAALARAASNCEVASLRMSIWTKLLKSNLASEIEILAAISGRAWHDLKDQSLLNSFLSALSKCNQDQFNILLVDLMALPNMRDIALEVMRSPKRVKSLQEKIGVFFQMSRKA